MNFDLHCIVYANNNLNLIPQCQSSDGKESACSEGDLGSVPELGRSPGGGHGNPLQYSCLENPCEPRSLVGYSCKESGKTEGLSTPQHIQHRQKLTYLTPQCKSHKRRTGRRKQG